MHRLLAVSLPLQFPPCPEQLAESRLQDVLEAPLIATVLSFFALPLTHFQAVAEKKNSAEMQLFGRLMVTTSKYKYSVKLSTAFPNSSAFSGAQSKACQYHRSKPMATKYRIFVAVFSSLSLRRLRLPFVYDCLQALPLLQSR